MKIKIFAAFLLSIAVLIVGTKTVSAEIDLPEGAVKGLPTVLTAMDSNGNIVNSASGEYFFLAENMVFGEVYTKDIQLMNLCEDKAYNIYFNIEAKPDSKLGDIDLEKGCVCSFYLDGTQFYYGSITGAGNIDLSKKLYDLGYYEPGSSHVLTCSIAWVNVDGEYFIDEGHRLIDRTGTWILTPRNGNNEAYGEIEFKWIFYAAQNESYTPPNTGLLSVSGSFWIICITAAAVMIVVLTTLIIIKKSKAKKRVKKNES
ncbi:MAG: hypothetical protein II589_00745 [Clostridia bacterium]|nr:hypothetical protein [Clostridia bacterium]